MAQKMTTTIDDRPSGERGKAQTPASFIMALPVEMPATDVVSQGKVAGLIFTESWVYKVRRAARGQKPQTAGRGRRSSERGAAPAVTEARLSKEEFVRTFSSSMPAAEAMAMAQRMGIELTFGELIDALSSRPVATQGSAPGAGQGQGQGQGPAKGRGKKAGREAAPVNQGWALKQEDAELVELILRVGLERVEQMLARFRTGLKEMRGGG